MFPIGTIKKTIEPIFPSDKDSEYKSRKRVVDFIQIFFGREFFEIKDLVRLAQTNREWHEFITEDNTFWEGYAQKDGIPFVSNSTSEKSQCNYEQFKILYPMTIGKRFIREYLGEPIGEVPYISEKDFNHLKTNDPFDSSIFWSKNSIQNHYKLITVFPKIKRSIDETFPFTLNEDGILTRLNPDEMNSLKGRELIISIARGGNWDLLTRNPLKDVEKNAHFTRACSDHTADTDITPILEKCKFSEKPTTYLVRNSPVMNCYSVEYLENHVKEKGFTFLPFEVLSILQIYKRLERRANWSDLSIGSYTSDIFSSEERKRYITVENIPNGDINSLEVGSSPIWWDENAFEKIFTSLFYGVIPGVQTGQLDSA